MKNLTRLFLAASLALCAATANFMSVNAAGISEKQLAVDLTFNELPPNLTNFDIQGFRVSGATLVAYGTLAGTVDGTSITVPFEIPVTALSASCDLLSLDLGPVVVDTDGLVLNINQVSFDIVALPESSSAVQSLLCTAAHIAQSSGNVYALASALNRVLPAVQ